MIKSYAYEEFIAAGGNPIPPAQFKTYLQIILTGWNVMPDAVTDDGANIRVIWSQAEPTPDDEAKADQAVVDFVPVTTTDQPGQVDSFAAATTTLGTLVNKITLNHGPLTGGRWRVMWVSSIRMQTVGVASGVQATMRVARSDGPSVQQTDAWDLNVNHAYNGVFTFEVPEGLSIQATLGFSRLGLLGTAEMSGAQVVLDKVG